MVKPRNRYGNDPWKLQLTEIDPARIGLHETVFAQSNGFLGMRANFAEGLPVSSHGTFLNGLHETWKIEHAENAYGFAETGQTIVNVPDTKTIRLYVDDERLNLNSAEIVSFHRELDMRDGVVRHRTVWRTPTGKTVTIELTRMVSFVHRHISTTNYTVTVDQAAEVIVSSLLVNRQDLGRVGAQDETVVDPRKTDVFQHRILEHERSLDLGLRSVRCYRTLSSRMAVVVGVDHALTTAHNSEFTHDVQPSEDRVRHVFQGRLQANEALTLLKTSAYDYSATAGPDEMTDRCTQQLDEQQRRSFETRVAEQRGYLDAFWERSAVTVEFEKTASAETSTETEQLETQQAINWNLFQLAQAAARADGRGIAAKGLTGSGYSGHYFWDSEIYVSPFLVYTSPQWARNALSFRAGLLPASRRRARELHEDGALFAWRTINGEEASAYYAAGTAQYHINADITYALARYALATADLDFASGSAGDIAVETARMWVTLGFWRRERDGSEGFHIHGVTGPDEYTAVVNDNLYTNVMARFNLRAALRLLEVLRQHRPEAHARMVERLGITPEETAEWRRIADGMAIPFDAERGVHPQDAHFLEKEVWDLAATPPAQKPLLLHFHPLVIYRFQVLKQADVVLAMLLASEDFDQDQKRANFEYYDQLTTGDSSLSAVVQSVIAAEVGYRALAAEYFDQALRVDLDDLHSNTSDGVHIASAGGVWITLVQGFAGMRDVGGKLSFDPRLPQNWRELRFKLIWRGNSVRVTLTQTAMTFSHLGGDGEVEMRVRDETLRLRPETEHTVVLEHQGVDLGEFRGLSAGMLPRNGRQGWSEKRITTDIPTV